jgi:uncharacterized 2Fe-2S/4Fe-4S cluster protein (DUF4445 family)
MADFIVTFDGTGAPVKVPLGTLLVEAAQLAGVEVAQPCGGQGRCGRCAVRIREGQVRRRSTLRLSKEDVAQGYALACQAIVEADVTVEVPPAEEVAVRMATDRVAEELPPLPAGYDPLLHQSVRRLTLTLSPPSMDDQIDDWSRLQTALRQAAGLKGVSASLPLLRRLGDVLRAKEWQVTALVDLGIAGSNEPPRLMDLLPGLDAATAPLWGAAVDIGTTTVTVWLVDLLTGKVLAQAAEYNRQISRGEDVISRIIYAGKDGGGEELRALVLTSINRLLQRALQRAGGDGGREIVKATVAGNSTMIHLLLGLPPETIRRTPFITTTNQPPPLLAQEVGLEIHPAATVDCLPGIASYVGADISAGVLASGLDGSAEPALFLDIGTNGETVLGCADWLVTCACSAGPAFEGAGVRDGMRASRGAIEEVWIDGRTYEPTTRVIGGGPPRGLCGSGLISLLAELFITGVVDKGGHFKGDLPTPRVRAGEHGLEYVVARGGETEDGEDIALTSVDVDNLLRAKAAIYAGFSLLAESVGLPLATVERVLIGGAFGKYINVEKAVEIGLLPDMPWERFQFLGNTAVRGAYLALLDNRLRARLAELAAGMTYVELSADNRFFEAFNSALFMPHTELSLFPKVMETLQAATAGGARSASPNGAEKEGDYVRHR